MKGVTSRRLLGYLLIIAVAIIKVNGRPRYIDCTDSTECGFGYCCALGIGRFSLPHCMPLGEIQSTCTPRAEIPLNVTVNYPDGEVVELTNIHTLMCPCQTGLYCSRRTGTCQDPLEDVLLNTID